MNSERSLHFKVADDFCGGVKGRQKELDYIDIHFIMLALSDFG